MCVDGVSGITLIDTFDTDGFSSRIGGSDQGFRCQSLYGAEARAELGSVHALRNREQQTSVRRCRPGASLKDEAHRFGIFMGSGIGGLHTIEKNYERYMKGGPRRISPFFVPGSIVNMVSGPRLHRPRPDRTESGARDGLRHVDSLHRACGQTHRLRRCRRHACRRGSEYATTPSGSRRIFGSARALSTRNDEPERASRPWDQDRDGFVLERWRRLPGARRLRESKATRRTDLCRSSSASA